MELCSAQTIFYLFYFLFFRGSAQVFVYPAILLSGFALFSMTAFC